MDTSKKLIMKFHKCKFCSVLSEHKLVVRRHLQARHKEKINKEKFPIIIDTDQNINSSNSYDIRFIENFKLFISGPSG